MLMCDIFAAGGSLDMQIGPRTRSTLLTLFGAVAGYVFGHFTIDTTTPREFQRGDVLAGTVVRVSDGDTFTMEGPSGKTRMRIYGLSAPENSDDNPVAGKTKGAEATRFMKDQVLNREVRCEVMENKRSHDRIIARCYVRGVDIATTIIKGGHARACPALGGREYLSYETRASEKLPLPTYCRS
jgi:endonuclease YncB( thermonuclease family)